MKIKNLSLIAGAIALSLTAIPFSVKAETTSSAPLLVAQAAPQKGPWQSLGLTDSQKSQIREIRKNARTQMDGILTSEQKEKLKAAHEARQAQRSQPRDQRQRRENVFASLNLTEQQKAQMRQIRESSKQQIQAILTPEQQQKFQQFQENMRNRRQERNF